MSGMTFEDCERVLFEAWANDTVKLETERYSWNDPWDSNAITENYTNRIMQIAWDAWQKARKQDPCNWRWDDCHQKWDTQCGTAFWIDSDYESPKAAGFQFCPNCGCRIETVKPAETEPEE